MKAKRQTVKKEGKPQSNIAPVPVKGGRRKLLIRKPVADDYAWYLHGDFRNETKDVYFNRSHWWESKPKEISDFSAAYEVLRRHPDAFGLHSEACLGTVLGPIAWFLTRHGLQNWIQLSRRLRKEFRDVLHQEYPGKGPDFTKAIHNITAQAESFYLVRDRNSLLYGRREISAELANIAKEARMNEIQRLAVEHYQAGRILIAVDLGASSMDELIEAFKNCYLQEECRRKHEHDKIGRSHGRKWLEIIAAFDDMESKRPVNVLRDATFKAYRRMVDGFDASIIPEGSRQQVMTSNSKRDGGNKDAFEPSSIQTKDTTEGKLPRGRMKSGEITIRNGVWMRLRPQVNAPVKTPKQ